MTGELQALNLVDLADELAISAAAKRPAQLFAAAQYRAWREIGGCRVQQGGPSVELQWSRHRAASGLLRCSESRQSVLCSWPPLCGARRVKPVEKLDQTLATSAQSFGFQRLNNGRCRLAAGPEYESTPFQILAVRHALWVCIVSFPDPFCARARNLKLGGGERPGKGSGKSSRPSTGNGRNAGAVRMECS